MSPWRRRGGGFRGDRKPLIAKGLMQRAKGCAALAEEKKNPRRIGGLALQLEREKGFESPANPVFSRPYAAPYVDAGGPRNPPDASGRVATARDAGDVQPPLPAPSPELFIAAGIAAADGAARTGATRSAVEEILRRAIDQAAALRAEVA